MKWSIVALIALGLLAAISASILVSTLRPTSGSAGKSSSLDVEVAVTTKSLPAMSVVTSSLVTKGTVSKKELPEGYLFSPVQAIGKVLAKPVVEGQILTMSCFLTEGTGAQLAASLPHGMRAISVNISKSAITGGLLYPGCVVDVLVSFKLPSGESGEAVSTTLLREIQLLAVEGLSIVSKEADENTLPQAERTPTRSGLTVTLMVEPKQAEALQLAAEFGSISLALRNPLDNRPIDMDVTILSQGRLAALGTLLDSTVLASKNGKDQLREQLLGADDPNEQTEGKSYDASSTDRPSWQVTVIRGSKIEQQSLKMQISEFTSATDVEG